MHNYLSKVLFCSFLIFYYGFKIITIVQYNHVHCNRACTCKDGVRYEHLQAVDIVAKPLNKLPFGLGVNGKKSFNLCNVSFSIFVIYHRHYSPFRLSNLIGFCLFHCKSFDNPLTNRLAAFYRFLQYGNTRESCACQQFLPYR